MYELFVPLSFQGRVLIISIQYDQCILNEFPFIQTEARLLIRHIDFRLPLVEWFDISFYR